MNKQLNDSINKTIVLGVLCLTLLTVLFFASIKVFTVVVFFVILYILIFKGDIHMLSFLKHWGKSNAKRAGTETRKMAARLDKEGFNDAVLGEMQEEMAEIGVKLSEARQRSRKERQEATEVQDLYNQRLAAAEAIKAMVDGGDTSKESSLLKMLDLLESTQTAVEKEVQEAEFWEKNLKIAQDRYDKAAGDLKGAKSKISQASAKMEQAEMKAEQAKLLEEQSKRASGLSSSMSSLDIALGALDDAATKAEAQADASEMSYDTFKSSNIEDEDDVIKEAMLAASGKGASASVTDRLSALR